MAKTRKKKANKPASKNVAQKQWYELKNALLSWDGDARTWAKNLQKTGLKSAKTLQKEAKTQVNQWKKTIKTTKWKQKMPVQAEKAIKNLKNNVSEQVERIQDFHMLDKTLSWLNLPTQTQVNQLQRKISRLEKQVQDMRR